MKPGFIFIFIFFETKIAQSPRGIHPALSGRVFWKAARLNESSKFSFGDPEGLNLLRTGYKNLGRKAVENRKFFEFEILKLFCSPEGRLPQTNENFWKNLWLIINSRIQNEFWTLLRKKFNGKNWTLNFGKILKIYWMFNQKLNIESGKNWPLNWKDSDWKLNVQLKCFPKNLKISKFPISKNFKIFFPSFTSSLPSGSLQQ